MSRTMLFLALTTLLACGGGDPAHAEPATGGPLHTFTEVPAAVPDEGPEKDPDEAPTATPKIEPRLADFSLAGIKKRYEEFRPLVEAELGKSVKNPVAWSLIDQAAVVELLARENSAFRSGIEGGPRGEELADACRTEAATVARILLAKLDTGTGGIHVQTQAFERLATLAPEYHPMIEQGFLDIILIHESVHEFQHRTFDMAAFIGRPRSMEEFQCRTAVIEGHAQYVTRRVAEKAGLGEMFDLLVLANSKVPSTITDPAMKLVLEVMTAGLGFAYIQGEEWFTGLVDALGYEEALKRAFASPPLTMRTVAHVDEYLVPVANTVDVQAIAAKAQEFFSAEEHVFQTVPLSEALLRAAVGIATPEEIAKGMAGYRSGALLVAIVKNAPQGTMRMVGVLECTSPEGALDLFEMERIVAEKKDEMFKKPGAMVQLLSSEYEKPEIEGATALFMKKMAKAAMREKPTPANTLLVARGRFVLEINATGVPDDLDALTALAKKVFALLPE